MKIIRTKQFQLVFGILIFIGSLLEWSSSDDVKCIQIVEDEDYVCLNVSEEEIDVLIGQNSLNLGVDQLVSGSDVEKMKTTEIIHSMKSYLIEEVIPYGEPVLSVCNNKHELCSFWATKGECENTRPYMIEMCPLSCRMCLASYVIQTDF
jgi:hypothetical protein